MVLEVNVSVEPTHIGPLFPTGVGVAGIGFTVTETVVVLVHPPLVPTTVYVVVVVGLAVGLDAVVELSPVLGDQLYVLAPEAVSVVLNPLHIVTLDEIVTVGV